MGKRDERRPVWIVVGPLDPDKAPAGCRAETVPPKLVLQLSELLRLMGKLARVSSA